MATPKPKTPVRRTKKAAISPPPEGPVGGMSSAMDPSCGHSDCGRMCNVRYVGPTSHMRDHHIVHAARGVAHVWTAAIVTGLAIVLTGAIAYTSVQAATTPAPSVASVYTAIQNLNTRLDKIDAALARLNSQCSVTAQCNSGSSTTGDGTTSLPPSQDSCAVTCSQQTLSCLQNAGDATDARQKCLDADKSCRSVCPASPTKNTLPQ